MPTRRSLILGAGATLATFGLGAGTGALLTAGEPWQRGGELPRADPVQTDHTLPQASDVVVIGGGIAGLSTAHFLRQRGFDVVVIEKGVVAGEQSSRAFGWIYNSGWHPEKLPLATRAKAIWAGFAEDAGGDIGYRRSGNLTLLDSDEGIEAQRAWLEEASGVVPDLDQRIVTGSELEALTPGAAQSYRAALYSPTDGIAEPTIATSRIAGMVARVGVRIVQRTAVRTVETEGGAISHVVTERGIIRTSRVVVAGGAWSRLFLGNLGVPFPQLGIASPLMRVSRVAGPDGAGFAPDYSWRRRIDGDTVIGAFINVSPITRASFAEFLQFLPSLSHAPGLLTLRFGQDFFNTLRLPTHWSGDDITPFERNRLLTATPLMSELELRLANLRAAFPAFEAAEHRESWAGVIDATPDSTPVISAIDDRPGLFLISGFSGNGLTVGPAAGEMLAQTVAGEEPVLDRDIYRHARFFDGTKLTFRH